MLRWTNYDRVKQFFENNFRLNVSKLLMTLYDFQPIANVTIILDVYLENIQYIELLSNLSIYFIFILGINNAWENFVHFIEKKNDSSHDSQVCTTARQLLYVASSKVVSVLDPLHSMPKTDTFPFFLLSLLLLPSPYILYDGIEIFDF